MVFLLAASILRAQEKTHTKDGTRPDTTVGVLCFNAQGEPGIQYNKDGAKEFHKLDGRPVAAIAAPPKQIVKAKAAAPAAATAASATPGISGNTRVSPRQASAKSRADSPRTPPVLEEGRKP